jgi:hypothetical protein
VVSAIGTFIAVTTLFLIASTAYMSWRVYKMEKYKMKGKVIEKDAEKVA